MTGVKVETVNANYVLEIHVNILSKGKYNREKKINIKEPLGKEPEEKKEYLKDYGHGVGGRCDRECR